MLEPVLFGLKILFLLLLYLFIFMIVRRLTRDLSRGAEPVEMPAPAPAAAPKVRAASPSRQPEPVPQPVPQSTSEFDRLVTELNPRLVVQHSTILENGTVYELEGGATIGRSPASDIVLPDDYVSQTHARIFPRKQFLFIEDLGSLNGTFVDGRRVDAEHQIKPGQELVIGDTIFRFEE